MQTQIKKPSLVLVEWEDSMQPSSSWRFLTDFDDHKIVKCLSVGWMIGDGKDVKALAPNIGNPHDNTGVEQASGVIRIPARAITRLVKLKEVK